MDNVLLDCGTHFGQGMTEFMHRFGVNDSWIVHTWEANPVTFKYFMENHYHGRSFIRPHQKAISDHDGIITINIETPPGEGETGMGSSVIDLNHWNPWGGTLRQNFVSNAQVECIDFSKFIRENFTPEDNIICKMDIEGSEYDVLEHMIEEGTVQYIKHLSVEWHSRFFTNKDEIQAREAIIQDKIRSLGVTLENWK